MSGTHSETHHREHYDSLGVDEAQARILSATSPLAPASIPLDEALDLTLAEDIVAGIDLPPFANSAMDGYAIRASSTHAATAETPARLRVIGSIMAGHSAEHLAVEPGVAVRIMTGASIPTGADAVIRFEDTGALQETDGEPHFVVNRAVPAGENIRPAGEDTQAGDTVLLRGARLRPSTIGLIAALGHNRVLVHPRPRVGILVTGDEIVEPGQAQGPGQIWNSNGPMVAALVRQCGSVPVALGPAPDTPKAVRNCLDNADVDLLVTTGGISIGDRDVLRDVLLEEPDLSLWNLRIKPGKPLAFGRRGDATLIGLPGNPVAAAVSFSQFVRPAIQVMLGRTQPFLPEIRATSQDRLMNRIGRRQFVRVSVKETSDGYLARSAGGQGSAMMTSLAQANGLLVIPETCDGVEPGDIVTVQMLDWDCEA